MSMDKRTEFLNQIWQPYSAAPPGAISLAQAALKDGLSRSLWLGGEILQLGRKGSDFQILLGAQGQQREFFGHDFLLHLQTPQKNQNAKTLAGFDFLRAGDKVILREVDGLIEGVLLAPSLTPLRPSPLTPEMARLWQDFLRDGRAHFTKRGFIEVSTPTLVPCPGFEPTLEPFVTELRFGRERQQLFLPTSPEIHLKKMLARGWSEIFEIRSCFRNDEFSPHHQPEFTMLEWYRSYCGLEQLQEDVRQLFQDLSGKENLKFQTYSVADLFWQVLQFELKPSTQAPELLALANQKEMNLSANESLNDLFHCLWVQFIDPWLAEQDLPLFVTHFPPEQAALSRIGQDGWAERLEVYWCGLEIANGFHELNDPKEQRQRVQKDLLERKRLGRTPIAGDEDFLLALESGIAPGVGIAVGVERLFMAIHGINEISRLKAFPAEN